MKIFKKLKLFHTIDLTRTLSGVITILIFISSVMGGFMLFKENLTKELVSLTLAAGTKTHITLTEGDIARSMLNLSIPTATFVKVEHPPILPEEEPTEINTEPVILPNMAESITYKGAEENGYTSIDGIYINNQTTKKVDIASLLNKKLDLTVSEEPYVLIMHTHTSESYTPSVKYNYIATDSERTTDTNFNMASVGEVIYNRLTEAGINTIHDKTLNDYPSYSKSYSNSLKLVEGYIKKYPSIKIVIDVHRDAIITKDGKKMRPMTTLSPPSSQVMLVVGTNDSGLSHPSWETNLSFSLKLQQKMNSLYPTLARPINLRRERFNQHTAPYAFILEVGTNGNTLEEAKEGAKLFSDSLISLLKN